MRDNPCFEGEDVSAPRQGRFFSKIDWASFWTSAIISFIIYFLTVAPSVTLEDCGELAVAGDHLGVPHPPGYPLWTMCAWVFARIFSFVTFRGQPNPAWAIALLSGVFAALAAGLTAMLVTRTSSDILHAQSPLDELSPEKRSVDGWLGRLGHIDTICWVAGVASSLVFAFSPVMWSQSTIVEVYTLNAFFLMFIFVMTYRWMCRPTERVLWLTAFVFGLGLTNYQVLLLAIIPLVIVIMLQNIELFRDFVLVVIPFVLTAGMMKLGSLPSQPGFPKHSLLSSNDITSSAVVAGDYYFWGIALLAIFVAATAYAGFLSVRKSKGVSTEQEASWFRIASLVSAVAGVVLLMVCLRVPAAPAPEAFHTAPADQMFVWALPTLVLLGGLATLFVFALFTPAGVWYALSIAGIQLAVAIFIKKGALLGLTHPLSGAFAFYVSLNFVVLGLAWLLLPFGKTVSLTVLAAEFGVAFYGYMPISSEMNPPMNWGYPRTWEGFKHALTRGQYEQITPTTMFSPLFIKQLGAYFADMRMQFTLMLAPFGFVPFAVWGAKIGKWRFNATKWAVLIAALVAALIGLEKVTGMTGLGSYRFDKILVAILLLLAFIGAHAIVISQLVELAHRVWDRCQTASARLISGLSCAFLAFLIIAVALGFCNAAAESLLEWHGVFEPSAGAARNAHRAYLFKDFLLTGVLYVFWLGAVGFLSWMVAVRHRWFSIEIKAVTQRWQIATIACFLVMSLGLIALANPRYDIQDNFIQKVKFVSSHGIFAIWIGYGLAYAMVAFRKFRLVGGLFVVAVLLTPLVPIHENYFNEELIDTMSAADQTGHDFGWQFGNYQLRGADAITEELDQDEEPLPNPEYPPAMTPNAVFYGGTDPGRFVPTYMIYSAKVRPDVFLITQNALADNTYMDTMRNLYSDDIWMPTIDDNSAAFQEYVEDVQAGRRQNIGGINMEGGRVQVTGALAVMEINGILTEKIFRKNRNKHDFYVEESYAIRWMYPYLTPHGLIMKINHDHAPYSPEVVRNDSDFWDWYARRLLANPLYFRDFVARKSFSKLRSAIAGTYSNRRSFALAERAFQEARALYIYSPEANLRLIQEVLLPQRRISESVDLLTLLQRLDPNNVRIPLGEIQALERAEQQHTILTKQIAAGETLSEDALLTFLESGFQIGLPQHALNSISKHVKDSGLSPEFAFKTGMVLASNGRNAEASEFLATLKPSVYAQLPGITNADLRRIYDIHLAARNQQAMLGSLVVYLPKAKDDWRAWLDYASLTLATGDNAKAKQALDFAVKFGGREAEAVIAQVEHLRKLHQPSVGPLRNRFGPSNRFPINQ